MRLKKTYLFSLLLACMSSYSYATSLEEALIHTYHTNHNILAERENLKITDELMSEALTGFLPDIRAKGSRNRVASRNTTQRSINSPVETFDYKPILYTSKQIGLSQQLFTGGSTLLDMKIAENAVLAARARLNDKEQEILLAAIQAYINVLSSSEKVHSYMNNINILTKHMQSTEEKFALGEVTRTDVAQAKAKLSKAVSDHIKANATLSSAESNYEAIVGMRSDALSLPDNIENIPGSLNEIVELGIANNPKIIAARFTKEQESTKVSRNLSNFSPKLSLDAYIEKDNKPQLDVAGNGLDKNSKNRVAMLNLEVPIYQKGAEYQAVRKQKNSLQRSKNALQAEIASLSFNITKTWEDITLSNSVINSASESVEYAKVALEGVTQEAAAGNRTTLEVLDTEQTLLDNKLNLVDAKYQRILNIYTLKSLLGKLTASELALSTNIYDPKLHYDKVKLKIIGF